MGEEEIRSKLSEAKTIIDVITISGALKSQGADVMLVNRLTKEARENLAKLRQSISTITKVAIPIPSSQKMVCIPFTVDSLSNPYMKFDPQTGVTLQLLIL